MHAELWHPTFKLWPNEGESWWELKLLRTHESRWEWSRVSRTRASVDESFTGKQTREPGKHPGKTFSDVNMAINQIVYSALALSLVTESDAILVFLFYLSCWGKSSNRWPQSARSNSRARPNETKLSWKVWAGSNSMNLNLIYCSPMCFFLLFSQGHCFVAVNPQMFADGFDDRMQSLMDQYRNLKPVSCTPPPLPHHPLDYPSHYPKGDSIHSNSNNFVSGIVFLFIERFSIECQK